MYWFELILEVPIDKIPDATLFYNLHDIYTISIDDPNDLIEHQSIVRFDYIDESLLNRDMETAYVKAYFENEEEALSLMEEAITQGFKASIKKLKAEDWENGWKKYYKPFKLGEKIVIVPAWEEYEVNEDEYKLTLDSGMAFGTGTHETTKMCVEFIEKYVDDTKEILDIGTGSGILSIAAGLFGAKKIHAVDIDELAVKIAKENVALNNLSDRITIEQGDLIDEINGNYDIIIANIVADAINILFSKISKNMHENSLFITSGIITERRDEVINNALNSGFVKIDEKEEDGWTSLVFRKG